MCRYQSVLRPVVRNLKPSGTQRDHSSNLFPLRGLMVIHGDADWIRQVSSLCPWCRCSKVILSWKQSQRKTGSDGCCVGVIEQNYRYTQRWLKNEMSSRDNFCPLLGGKWSSKHLFSIHLGVFRVQQLYTWKTVSHKLPICFFFFYDLDRRVLECGKHNPPGWATSWSCFISVYLLMSR